MKIKIEFFAFLKEVAGERIDFETPKDISVNDLLDRLIEKYPDMEKYRTILKVAVNSEYVGLNFKLQENDQIAVFPPVSGG